MDTSIPQSGATQSKVSAGDVDAHMQAEGEKVGAETANALAQKAENNNEKVEQATTGIY